MVITPKVSSEDISAAEIQIISRPVQFKSKIWPLVDLKSKVEVKLELFVNSTTFG